MRLEEDTGWSWMMRGRGGALTEAWERGGGDRQKSRRFRSHRNKGESEKPVKMGAGRSST